jgi:hypothetical protein
MIKGAGPHPDQYFMRTYDRVWSILILQDLRTTVLVESNRFHDLSFHGSLLEEWGTIMHGNRSLAQSFTSIPSLDRHRESGSTYDS